MTKNYLAKSAQHILVTGPSGSGKTYIAKALQKDEINAVDADDIPNLGVWLDKKAKKVKFPHNASSEWLHEHEYIYDENVLISYLKQQKSVLLFGISSNIFYLLHLFSKTFYLSPTPELLEKRLSSPQRRNPMGKTKEQRDEVISSLEEFSKKAQEYGFTTLNADQSPKEIYQQIMKK
jgi:shikimate kinase